MENLVTIKIMIDEYRKKWISFGKWKDPTIADSLLFLGTELNELKNACYTDQYKYEAFDCLTMALISMEKMGFELQEYDTTDYPKLDPHLRQDFLQLIYWEAVEQYLRTKNYIRNNEKQVKNNVLSGLCFLLLKEMGPTPVATASHKLDKMDKKRSK